MRIFSTILILLSIVFSSVIVQAKNKNEIIFQKGTITLSNGTTLNGLVALKNAYSEDEVLFKKDESSNKIYTYPISKLSKVYFGNTNFNVHYISIDNSKTQIALLETITDNKIKLYKANFYKEIPLGKNNRTIKREETYFINYMGEFIALKGNDFKNDLEYLLSDEQAYVERIKTYNKVGINELHQIFID